MQGWEQDGDDEQEEFEATKNPPKRVFSILAVDPFSRQKRGDGIPDLNYRATTLAAAGPFWPCSMVNSTR